MKKYFPLVQDLHNYIGLFISPFILIFSVSVLVLNHPRAEDKAIPAKTTMDKKMRLEPIPFDSTDLATGKAIIRRLGVAGEIDYVFKGEHDLSIRVSKPGVETNIKVNTLTDSVFIKQVNKGVLQGTVYLHKMPGPHLAQFRKNTVFMKLWSFFADATVYLILFLTVSGIFLWYFLKVERKMGIYALCIGSTLFIILLSLIL